MIRQSARRRWLRERPGYVSAVQYSAHGAVKQATYGSGLTDVWTFDNKRLQPWELKTTASGQSMPKLDLRYYYCSGQAPNQQGPCLTNNGNVQAAVIATSDGSNVTLNVTQNFAHDGDNRLCMAQ